MKLTGIEFDKIDFINSVCRVPKLYGKNLSVLVNNIVVKREDGTSIKKRSVILNFKDVNYIETQKGQEFIRKGKLVLENESRQIFYFGSFLKDKSSIEIKIQASTCELSNYKPERLTPAELYKLKTKLGKAGKKTPPRYIEGTISMPIIGLPKVTMQQGSFVVGSSISIRRRRNWAKTPAKPDELKKEIREFFKEIKK